MITVRVIYKEKILDLVDRIETVLRAAVIRATREFEPLKRNPFEPFSYVDTQLPDEWNRIEDLANSRVISVNGELDFEPDFSVTGRLQLVDAVGFVSHVVDDRVHLMPDFTPHEMQMHGYLVTVRADGCNIGRALILPWMSCNPDRMESPDDFNRWMTKDGELARQVLDEGWRSLMVYNRAVGYANEIIDMLRTMDETRKTPEISDTISRFKGWAADRFNGRADAL